MGWIGVDLDCTLAKYPSGGGHYVIGEPIPLMVQQVREWLAQGREVRIFTARVCDPNFEGSIEQQRIQVWCEQHLGQRLKITNKKDYSLDEYWDDKAVGVEPNTGRRIG